MRDPIAESAWPLVRLKDVTVPVPSWDPSCNPNAYFTYIDISSIDNEVGAIVEPKQILGRDAPTRARRPVVEGDVLFSNVRTYLRNVARVYGLEYPAVASTGFTLLRPSHRLSSRYLYHLARSDFFISRVTPEQTGTHYPATSDRVVRDQLIPLPALSDQETIANLIDRVEDFRKSSLGHIRAARRAVESFREAVLAAACSGRLTADWRAANSPDSAARVLLAPHGRKRRSGSGGEILDLPMPDLPDSYSVGTVGAVSTVLEYGTSKRAEATGQGVPVLRMGNIQDGQLDLASLKYRPVDREIEKLMLRDGDLLFNRTNSPELVGKSAVFHGSEPMTFASYLIRVRFAEDVADPDFASYWINSAWGRAWARQVKTDGVSQSNINGTKLGAMPLPLPPIEEQREIVRRASRMLRTANDLLERVAVVSRRVERGSQAVLEQAFRGELAGARDSAPCGNPDGTKRARRK